MLELSGRGQLNLEVEQKKSSVLVVDDEPFIRDLCCRALKDYQVSEAADGQEALELFRGERFDVVLTDVMMPRMGGLELLKQLKEIEPTAVVVVMTGFAEKDVILNALKADADDFITKPLNLIQLKVSVENALLRKALKEEVANLKSMDRFKSNFLSLISHKFRTPITSISLFLQNLSAGIHDPEDPEFRKYLRLTYEETCYLERLVADLLSFSEAMDEGGRLKLESCNPSSLVRQVVQSAAGSAGNGRINLQLELHPVPDLLLDREKFSFAVRQVLENAYKFSPEGGTVLVRLEADESRFSLTISDQGIGIEPEDLPRIFEKFYQGDSSAGDQTHGFGLGLFYAHEMIKLHNGTITVDSEPGRGTSITVSIPIEAS